MTVEFTLTLVLVRLQLSPVAGETPSARVTVPLKPKAPIAVTVEVPVAPARIVTLPGVVLIE